MTPKDTLADFIRDSRFEDFPAEVIYVAKRSLLDALGNMIAGFSTNASRVARSFASGFTQPQDSTIIGTDMRVPCAFAAFANALMASDLDADDGHRGAMGHPGAAIIAAALAAGEKNQVAGRRFMEAVVVGYEIGIRMGVIANTGYENRFCGSGNWSSFGATAAVSKLTDLSREECVNALGICEAHSPMAPMDWMFSGDYSMIKEAIGWGAFTGVSSALLAQRGMTGTFAFADDHETVMNSLGREYEFKQIYFKLHSSCRYTHPSIDGVLRLREQNGFRDEDIAQINIGTFSFALGLGSKHPKSTQEAQYSIPFTVGAALAYGQVGPTEMSQDRLHDDRILALAEKVRLYLEPGIQKRFPASTLAEVRIRLIDGTELVLDPIATRGDHQTPFSEAELDQKTRRYAKVLLSEEEIHKLISLGKTVDSIENIAELVDAVGSAIGKSCGKN